MDSLGDRIKNYENVTRHFLCRRMPVMIRVDGRCFSTLTKHYEKPFDANLMKAMIASALKVARDMSGFKAAYVQSDEATFLITDYDNIKTEGWFDYNLSKIISLSASIMTYSFNIYNDSTEAAFDSRAWNIPRNDVANAFLWRMKDWERNSLQMYCRSFFSHKELLNVNHANLHEMLHSIDKNWTKDLSEIEKNGTWLFKKENDNKFVIVSQSDILPTYQNVADIIDPLIYNEQENYSSRTSRCIKTE